MSKNIEKPILHKEPVKIIDGIGAPFEENKELKIELAKCLRELVKLLGEITEFNSSELKAISILQTDKYLSRMLDFYVVNKKHLKRKHSPEILKAFDSVMNAIASIMGSNQGLNIQPEKTGFINRLRGR